MLARHHICMVQLLLVCLLVLVDLLVLLLLRKQLHGACSAVSVCSCAADACGTLPASGSAMQLVPVVQSVPGAVLTSSVQFLVVLAQLLHVVHFLLRFCLWCRFYSWCGFYCLWCSFCFCC